MGPLKVLLLFAQKIKKNFFNFLSLKNFFFLISIPKGIELNSESGSPWVLGLALGSDPRHKPKCLNTF